MPVIQPDQRSVESAARALERGELVAFPTETVYGLGADAENPEAVARIYAAKGRPSSHPVIVHLAPQAPIEYWADTVPPEARRLIDAFWPGPLTLILRRAAQVSAAVSGGQDSIGLRCPAHPVAQALLKEFKGGRGGVAAPSANRFGHVSPTTAAHVRDEFGDGPDSPLACILDGGQSEVGIESTILDLSRIATHGAVLLRPGQVTAAQIEQVLGMPAQRPDAQAPRASGTLEAHYAPHTPLAMLEAPQLHAALHRLAAAGRRAALLEYSGAVEMAAVSTVAAAARIALPVSAQGYAHGLYAALRNLDGVGADIILVEAPPHDAAWQGVNDRLRRAAYDSQGALTALIDG